MNMVVTSTPTIMSGYVVRWFADVADADHCEPVISASRERVLEHRPDEVTPEVKARAEEVRSLIDDWYRRGGHDHKVWLKYVTHDAPLFGSVTPVRYDTAGEKIAEAKR